MSFFTDANEDAATVSADNVATGPRVGFLESFAVGYNEQVRASAMFGIENEMLKIERRQIQELVKRGVEKIPSLPSQNSNMLDVAKYYVDGGEPEIAEHLSAYDERIEDLRKQHPDLELNSSREIFERVKSEATKYERRAQTDRRTWGGSVGMFTGGAVGSFNLSSDPFNFLTAPIGGAGKTILSRIAGQGATQGFIEGINQLTGVQEQRRLLGLHHGLGDAVSRVAGAAVGGAALQSAGEAVVFGARRWFRSTPTDTAPLPGATDRAPLPDTSNVPERAIPADDGLAAAKLTEHPDSLINYAHEASPYSSSRGGRSRTVDDLDHITARLEEWDGVFPSDVAPKVDTELRVKGADLRGVAERSQIKAMATKADPETMKRYEKLSDQMNTIREQLRELTDETNVRIQKDMDFVDDKIYKLQKEKDSKGGRGARKVKRDIVALEKERAELVDDTPSIANGLRRQLMTLDEKMRDIAPLVSRAYARANKKWENTAADRDAVYSMIRKGEEVPTPVLDENVKAVEAVGTALADRAPILRAANEVADVVGENADAADVAKAIIAKTDKQINEAVEAFRGSVKELTELDKGDTLNVDGANLKLNLDTDTVHVPNDTGSGSREMTIREVLEETEELNTELEAVSTCSTR